MVMDNLSSQSKDQYVYENWDKLILSSIVEVGPRDGLQNISGEPVPTDTKLELIRRLFQSGVKVMEVGSFVRADRVPQVGPQIW